MGKQTEQVKAMLSDAIQGEPKMKVSLTFSSAGKGS